MTCPPWQSRRNLQKKQDRVMWEETRKEDHPLRYRLYCENGEYNIRADRGGWIAEIHESRPYKIERLPIPGEKLPDFPQSAPVLLGLGILEVA